MRRLIRDRLRYWGKEIHVDGDRFDLASILTRDEAGRPLPNPPVLWDIETDPLLAGTTLIAAAWDAAGIEALRSLRSRFLLHGMPNAGYPVPPRASAFLVLPLRADSRQHPATGVQGVP